LLFEQRDLELVFQLFHLQADGGLRTSYPVRGARKAAGIDACSQGFEQIQFQDYARIMSFKKVFVLNYQFCK
jgi:hypothetical protein